MNHINRVIKLLRAFEDLSPDRIDNLNQSGILDLIASVQCDYKQVPKDHLRKFLSASAERDELSPKELAKVLNQDIFRFFSRERVNKVIPSPPLASHIYIRFNGNYRKRPAMEFWKEEGVTTIGCLVRFIQQGKLKEIMSIGPKTIEGIKKVLANEGIVV